MIDEEDMDEASDNVRTFTVRGKEYKLNMADEKLIDPNNLEEELCDQAGKFYFYADAYEWAEKSVLAAKYDVECAYAQLDKEYRSNLSGKVTEKVVEGAILTDVRYIGMQDKYLAAIENRGALKAAMEAMKQRKDMLVQISANRRAEMGVGIGTT